MNTGTDFKGRTILIVDDNAANLGVIADYLEAFDFNILTALDGQDALETVRNVARPDLILLDVMMPGIDGFETCRRLKADEQTQEIPVIFMTALASTDDKVKGFEAGGVDYVTKPVNQEEVLARATTHLRLCDLTRAEKQRRLFAESLEETGRILSSSLDMHQVPDLILERLADVVPYERGAVLLAEGDVTRIIAERGFPQDKPALGLCMPIRQGDVFHQLLTTHRPLLLDDVSITSAWQQIEWLPINKSWLGLPLVRQDKVIGMVSLTRRGENAFSPNDITLAAAFATQAAIALENANLYDQIKGFNQELEDRVRQRTAELHQAYERLALLDQNKMDFIQSMSRTLDIPLKTFLDYGQRLADDFNVQRSLTLSRYATSIYTSALQLKDIVKDIVQITAIESGALALKPQPVSLDALFQQVQREFQAALQKRRVELKLADMTAFTLEADEEHLRLVFDKLVENAIKYTPNGGHITIHVEENPAALGQSVEIVISDTGIGIKPELHEMIFTPFFHTGKTSFLPQANKTDFKAVGPGLGLAIAKGIVQAHGGRLWVESPGYDEITRPGSHFHIVLPLRQGT